MTNQPLALFEALSSAYELLRRGAFSEAEFAFKTLLPHYSDYAEVHWGILLCHYGVLYEQRRSAIVPVCYILRRRKVMDDRYCKQAIDHASGTLYDYYRSEVVRLENARRSRSFELDSKRFNPLPDFEEYETLENVVYEKDVSKAK
ncbi:MAG: hypothetical protein ACI4U2_04515, partial [Christensenellaceae bacterium]